MMDYFRWLAFVKFKDFFNNGVYLVAFYINAIFLFAVSLMFWQLSIILIILSAMFWAFCAFLFAQRAWNANLAEYEKFKDSNK